jgi:hypothetical protein
MVCTLFPGQRERERGREHGQTLPGGREGEGEREREREREREIERERERQDKQWSRYILLFTMFRELI